MFTVEEIYEPRQMPGFFRFWWIKFQPLVVIPGVSGPLATIKNITHDNYRLRTRVAFFICDVLKRVAAPADAKTCKSAEPQLLAANTKTERQEISRGSALVSQSNPSTLRSLRPKSRFISLPLPATPRAFLFQAHGNHHRYGSLLNQPDGPVSISPHI